MTSIYTQSLANEDDERQFIELPICDNDLVEFFTGDGERDIWFQVKYKNGKVHTIKMFPQEEYIYDLEAQSATTAS